MKPVVIILPSLVLIALATLVSQAARLGDLTANDEVLTPDELTYPVFEIRVPEGYTEIQVRASTTNFTPGFLIKDGEEFVHNFVPTGEFVGARRVYRALDTEFEARYNEISGQWEIDYKGIVIADAALRPWEAAPENITSPEPGSFVLQKELFVYRFCTTGRPAESDPPTWGTGSGDPDAWVYIANQTALPGDETEFRRQKWDQESALSAQLQPGGSPGYVVMFQPSRDMLGANEWMSASNRDLVWIYQVETVAAPGKPQHPNGTDIWNIMQPVEWRAERVNIDHP
jgi:hypothetical protein